MMQLKRLIQQLKSFLALDKENAIKKAQELDELQAKDQMDGKLFGIPMG